MPEDATVALADKQPKLMAGEKDMNIIRYSIWLIAPEQLLLWVS